MENSVDTIQLQNDNINNVKNKTWKDIFPILNNNNDFNQTKDSSLKKIDGN